MKGGMKDFKSFDEALVTPAVSVGTSPAYNGLPFVNAVSFGANGGYVQKYSKYIFSIYLFIYLFIYECLYRIKSFSFIYKYLQVKDCYQCLSC